MPSVFAYIHLLSIFIFAYIHLLSIFISILGGSILGVKFLDPLAGLLVSGMILKAGAESGYQRYLYPLFCNLSFTLLANLTDCLYVIETVFFNPTYVCQAHF